ncbi:MAG: serine/threonine protein kinase [Janthinobacterium lividum]
MSLFDDDLASPPAARPPFEGLTPEVVLDAIESVGELPDGRLSTLNSYENRVYQIGRDDAPPLIAKFYRPARWSDAAILEEHAFSAELADEELPVVAPLVLGGNTLHTFAGFRFALFERRGGRAPELEDTATLERLGRFIGRIHSIGKRRAYAERGAIDLATYGTASRDIVLSRGLVPADIAPAYERATELALERVTQVFETVGPVATLRLHGDCQAGNVLWTDAGPHFVDFDDSRMGPAVQDLWMLSTERQITSGSFADLLRGYEVFCDFDERELALVEALRTLRLMHYSAWIALRWDDPAFPAAFPWFGTQRYWEDRVLETREQIAAMQEDFH